MPIPPPLFLRRYFSGCPVPLHSTRTVETAFHRMSYRAVLPLRMFAPSVLTLPSSGQSRNEPSQLPHTARPPGGGRSAKRGWWGLQEIHYNVETGVTPFAPIGAQARFARTSKAFDLLVLRSCGTSHSPSAPKRSLLGFSNSCLHLRYSRSNSSELSRPADSRSPNGDMRLAEGAMFRRTTVRRTGV